MNNTDTSILEKLFHSINSLYTNDKSKLFKIAAIFIAGIVLLKVLIALSWTVILLSAIGLIAWYSYDKYIKTPKEDRIL